MSNCAHQNDSKGFLSHFIIWSHLKTVFGFCYNKFKAFMQHMHSEIKYYY